LPSGALPAWFFDSILGLLLVFALGLVVYCLGAARSLRDWVRRRLRSGPSK
jgi:hypothetical protein